MSESIRSRIQFFIGNGRSILDGHAQAMLKQPGEELVSQISRKGIPRVLGTVATGIFDDTFAGKIARGFARSMIGRQEREKREQSEQTLDGNYQSWHNEVLSFLSTISIQKPRLRPPGNSSLLQRRFAKTKVFSKAATKIRRGIAILEEISHEPLVYNTDIPQMQQKQIEATQKDAYAILKELESSLRSLIQSRLSSVSSKWWTERIPNDVRERAEQRKAKNERLYPWHPEQGLNQIFYVDFTDYAKIILRKDNWEEAFSPVFKDKEIISAKLKELEPIRNAVAHFRDLNHSEIQKLRLYAKEIVASISSVRSQTGNSRQVLERQDE